MYRDSEIWERVESASSWIEEFYLDLRIMLKRRLMFSVKFEELHQSKTLVDIRLERNWISRDFRYVFYTEDIWGRKYRAGILLSSSDVKVENLSRSKFRLFEYILSEFGMTP